MFFLFSLPFFSLIFFLCLANHLSPGSSAVGCWNIIQSGHRNSGDCHFLSASGESLLGTILWRLKRVSFFLFSNQIWNVGRNGDEMMSIWTFFLQISNLFILDSFMLVIFHWKSHLYLTLRLSMLSMKGDKFHVMPCQHDSLCANVLCTPWSCGVIWLT